MDTQTRHDAGRQPNGPAIASVVRILCGLPNFPLGALSCPADFGISYALDFQASIGANQVVVAAPTGCPSLRGIGATRSVTGAFWDALATAFAVAQPREYCDPFRGRLPDAPTDCGPPIG